MKSFPVKVLLTHLRPHLSDLASFWLLARWGERFFKGVSKAEIRYITTGMLPDDMPQEILEEEGILAVGVGGGPLDEHPMNGNPRKEGECEATLTAEALRKKSDRVLSRVLEEIRHCDLTREVRPTQLATLVKVRHRQNKNDPRKVIAWTNQALDALYESGASYIPPEKHRGLLREVADDIIGKHTWSHEPALQRVRNLIAETEGRNRLCTDFANIFKTLLQKNGEVAYEWVREAVKDLCHDSCSFFAAVEEVDARGEVLEFSSEKDTFPVVAIESENEHISQAARSRYCGYSALTIQRNLRGNVAILLNVVNEHVQKEGLYLGNLIRMLRLREQTLLGYPQGQWDVMGADGSLRRIRMWHYSKDADQILNGALSAPDVPHTKIPLPEVITIAQSAFKRKLVWEWCDRYARASEMQRRRGGFRVTRHHTERTELFADTDPELFNVSARPAVIAELDRIMVALEGT